MKERIKTIRNNVRMTVSWIFVRIGVGSTSSTKNMGNFADYKAFLIDAMTNVTNNWKTMSARVTVAMSAWKNSFENNSYEMCRQESKPGSYNFDK